MKDYPDIRTLVDDVRKVATLAADGTCSIRDASAFREGTIDRLARTQALAVEPDVREAARHVIRAAAGALGCPLASIHDLYLAVGRGEAGGFTCPAMNLRALAYDSARAAFRALRRLEAGAFLFEIARSEIGYTGQRPAEYSAALLAAAIKEGHGGPVFVQGDHFQASAKAMKAQPQKEIQVLRDLIVEALEAGFYNIDIDCSTLVDLSQPTIAEQQRMNCELTADFTAFIREREPKGVTVSVGGEIGEVGGKNSTIEEQRAFIDGYRAALAGLGADRAGISKISVQTGTTHGGVVGPDGKVVQVDVDFDTLEKLSKGAIEEYGLGGAVQHGASTLPEELFVKFPQTRTIEIHLATEFQNIVYDRLPADLKKGIYGWLDENAKDEKKAGMTDEQFYYKSRKKAIGPFKRDLHDLPAATLAEIGAALESKFERLFLRLEIPGTAGVVARVVRPPDLARPAPEALAAALA